MFEQAEIYLDNAATTKPCPEAIAATTAALAEEYGNASSIHARGQAAKTLLEDSRRTIADALGVEPEEIYFTSGATEANNLAIRGAAMARGVDAGAIVTSELEHPSVTRAVRGLRREGFTTRHIPAPNGVFSISDLKEALRAPTQLVSVMQVQNEMGYVFPVAHIAETVRDLAPDALMHCDATQAFCKLDVKPREMDVDLLSVASHKVYGPKGVGALYVKKGLRLFTNAFGGGQERGLRSGTEPVFLIAGFAAAVKAATARREESYNYVQDLNDYLVQKLKAGMPGMDLYSQPSGSPYIVTFAIPGLDSKATVRALGQRGICVSAGSACSMTEDQVPEGTWREKHPQAYQAAGIPQEHNGSMLRVSFCPTNTTAELDIFLRALQDCVENT